MRIKQQGVSLIELVVFIVVIGLALSGVMLAFNTALDKTSQINPQTTAIQLASARMDIIIGQRRMLGFTNFSDPCVSSPPAVCTVPAAITGYTITSTIAALTISGDTNYKSIDVTVTGPQGANAVLKSIVGKY